MFYQLISCLNWSCTESIGIALTLLLQSQWELILNTAEPRTIIVLHIAQNQHKVGFVLNRINSRN